MFLVLLMLNEKKKNDMHILCTCNVHFGFVIHTSTKLKKISIQF